MYDDNADPKDELLNDLGKDGTRGMLLCELSSLDAQVSDQNLCQAIKTSSVVSTPAT